MLKKVTVEKKIPNFFKQTCFFSWFTEMSSLVLDTVIVPFIKKVGDSAILECRFDLEGDRLYSVKWYKENEEFYRYTPVSPRAVQTWRVAGTKVDVSACFFDPIGV